jgi:hypothetical protein
MSLFPLSDPHLHRCLKTWDRRQLAFLLERVLWAQLSLAKRLSPLCHLPLTPGQVGHRTLWSRWCAVSMLERTESRAPLIARACWLLEVSSMNGTCFCCLNEQRLPEAWRKLRCREHPLSGSPFSQQPLLQKSKVSVSLPCSPQKERLCVVLPLMRVIWILEGSLLWHQSYREPLEFSSYKMFATDSMRKVTSWKTA